MRRIKFKKSRINFLSKLLSLVLVLGLFFDSFVILGDAVSYFSLRINYCFIDGTPAHDPYVATYPAGTENINITVTNPRIDGFDPMTSAEGGLSAATTTFEIDSLSENVNVTVYYIAGLTSYRVMYYKQNIYDDLYTRDNTVAQEYTDRRGYTGTNPTVLETENLFEGFTNLFHEPDAIAADGSTVFRVYYDRNYYSVGFDLGEGGYGVEPVYAKYQTTYHIGEPKRMGYTFLGWAQTDADSTKGEYGTDWHYIDAGGDEITEAAAKAGAVSFNEGIVPAENTYYKAMWQNGTTGYSVVYWIQKADAEPLDPDELSAMPLSEAQAIIGRNYSVAASKDFEDVTSGTPVNLNTTVNNAHGDSIPIKDFFGYNLNEQDKVVDGKPVDKDNNFIDFPDISDALRAQLTGNQKYYYDFNEDLSLLQFGGNTDISVSGDGTTRINVYYNRAEFTLKFYYAKEDSSGKLYLTSGTGGYSRKSEKNLRTRLNGATWKEVNVSLPTIDPKYSSQIPASCLGVDNLSGDKFYYYEMKCLYGAKMDDIWFNDAFSIIPGGYGGEPYRFTSWAVEYGTKYYYDHVKPNNYTVKGFYEKLGKDLMFREYNANGTATDVANGYTDRELHYVASWASVNSTNAHPWSFTYKNYVRLLPYEEDIITEMGYEEGVAELISGGNYIDILTNNGRHYGLTEKNKVETFDWGNRYNYTGLALAKAIKDNQTAVNLAGFTLVPDSDVENIYEGSGTYNPQSTWYAYDIDGDGTNDFEANRHADVVFLYNRNSYTLQYRNNNIAEKSYEAYYDAPLDQAKFNYIPTYPYPERAAYFQFAGWYFTPYYYHQVNFTNEKMPADDVTLYAKWVPKEIKVSFYPTYNDYYEGINRIGGEIPVDYGSYVPLHLVPADTDDPDSPRPKLNPPAEGAMFAGWYYLRDNIPVRFEPENVPVTALNEEASRDDAKLQLFAEWVTKDVAKYKVNYVEQGTDTEVAASTTGRAFVWKTRTFDAKSGSDLNSGHEWVEDGQNWWPTVNSHSIVVKANQQGEEYAPNEYTFEYIQKRGVYYKVQYLDSVNRTPLADPVVHYSTHASIKEDALFIPGYVAEKATQTLVLSASTESDPNAQQAEELESNVITFYFNKNDNEYLYEVEYYKQNVEDDGYSLFYSETLTVPIAEQGDTTVSVSDLSSNQYSLLFAQNGCTYKQGAAQAVTTSAGGETTTETVADNASVRITSNQLLTIRLYFDRNNYPYSYQYIDYHQEQKYNRMVDEGTDTTGVWNGVMETHSEAGTGKVEKEVTISAPQDLTYNGIPYTRINNQDITLIIGPTENNPDNNLVKIYYRKFTERELSYKLVCRNEDSPYAQVDYDPVSGDPQYGGLSMTLQTVEAYSGISDVIFYDYNEATVTQEGGIDSHLHLHRYNFLGWYDNPEGTGTPLTTNETLTKADLGLDESLPERDTTYYAVVEQELVTANFEFRYVEEPLPADDADATDVVAAAPTDPDGDYTGGYFDFSAPSTYQNNTPIPWHRTDGYSMSIEPRDNRVYKYEFAEWWEEDLERNVLVRHHNWNQSQEGWSPTSLQNQVTRNSNKHIIAVYVRREVTEMPYTINYSFVDRFGETKTFVKTGTLTSAQLDESADTVKINSAGCYELTDEFIIANSPYESNHGKTLRWSDDRIVKTSFLGDSTKGTVDRIETYVTAYQTEKTVYANYRTTPDGERVTISLPYGANYNTKDAEAMLNIEAPETYNGKKFSYWAVRKSAKADAPIVAKSYKPLFDLCMMDTYFLDPVYEGAAAGPGDKSAVLNVEAVATGEEDWLAWTWSDTETGAWVRPDSNMTFTGLRDKVKFARVVAGTDVTGGVWDSAFESNVWNYTDDLSVQDGGVYTMTSYSDKIINGSWSEPESGETPANPTESDASEPTVILTHLDYSRNRWTNSDGSIPQSGETDLLYSDFEIAFDDNGERIYGANSGYRAGVVFELCGTLGSSATFNPDRNYGFYSDPDKLKEAVYNGDTSYTTKNKDSSDATKVRRISCSEINTANMTTRNRIEFAQCYPNAYQLVSGEKTYTNSNYLMKATAYLIKGDTVTLSNSMYICLKTEASKDFATAEGWNITSAASGE